MESRRKACIGVSGRPQIFGALTAHFFFLVALTKYVNSTSTDSPLTGPRNHLIAAAVWAVIGYSAYHLELRQEEIIAEKLAVIRRNRDVQDAREAARKEMAQKIASGEFKLKKEGEVDGLSPKQLYEDWRDLAKRHLEERQKEGH